MSQPDAPQRPPHAEEGVWEELELLLDELSDDARRPQDVEEFYAALLAKVVAALAGRSGAVWLRHGDNRLRMVSEINDRSLAVADRVAHEQLLAAALARGGAMVVAPRTELAEGARNLTDDTIVVGIVSLASWLPAGRGSEAVTTPLDLPRDSVALVEVTLPEGRAPSSYRGARQLMAAACETAAEFHARRQLATLQAERRQRDALLEFARTIALPLELSPTILAIVNEGRRLLGCDRLSLLLVRGQSARLAGVSGVDRIERRGRAARALESLARHVVKLKEPIYYSDGQIDALPKVADAVHHYVDEHHARVMALVPVEVTEGEEPHTERRLVGVLVAEQFSGTAAPVEPGLVAEVAHLVAPALANSLAWRELPFGGVLRRLTWIRKPRSLFRAAVLWGVVAAAGVALATIQVPLRIDVRGQLLPVERQDVFAPRDAIVDELRVEHGDLVAVGQTLLTLRDPDLKLEIERAAGEISTLERQIEAIRTTRTTSGGQGIDPLERYRLSAQEEELKTKLAALEAQQELLAQELAQLEITSPLAGRVITWQVEQRLGGRPVERGQVLMSIADTQGEWQLELEIPDDEMDTVGRAAQQGKIDVEFRLASDAAQMHRATLGGISRRADLVQLPTGEEVRRVVAYAQPEQQLPQAIREAALRPGGFVRARLVCGESAVGYVWFREAWRAFRNWWEF